MDTRIAHSRHYPFGRLRFAFAGIAAAVLTLAGLALAPPASAADPPVNIVKPVLSGDAIVGLTLSVTPGAWSNTPTSYTYRWWRCVANGTGCDPALIKEGSDTTYSPTWDDIDSWIFVRVTAANSAGSSTPEQSNMVGLVTDGIGPANTASPEISGSPVKGFTLVTTTGSWNPTPSKYAYQWFREINVGPGSWSSSAIPGATQNSYVLTAADVGARIFVRVTATIATGSAHAESNVTQPVAGGVPPVNTLPPAITGQATVGSTLTVSDGTWDSDPAPSFAYQWRRCATSAEGSCVDITSATLKTYVLKSADVGYRIRARVTATNTYGPSSAISNPVGPVTDPPTKPVNITRPELSGTLAIGQTLTVTQGSWSGAPSTFTYEWWRCVSSPGGGCVPSVITGVASTTYTLTSDEVGATVYVKVTAANGVGATTVDSNTLGPMVGAIPPPVSQSPPVLSGDSTVGSTVTVSTGTWQGSPTRYEYEWSRCLPRPSGGCTPSRLTSDSSSYVLTAAELSGTVYVRVIAYNAGGFGTAYSNALGPVTAVTPDPGPQPVPPPPQVTRTGRPHIAKRGGKVIVTSGQLVDCPQGVGPCTARITAKTTGARSQVVANSTVALTAGASRKVTFPLRKKTVRTLRQTHHLRLRVTARVSAPGTSQVIGVRTFTLKQPAWLS